MAIGVALRPSGDAGNALGFGADQGLWAPSLTGLPRGGPYASTIDNSWSSPADPATYHYALPASGSATLSVTSGWAFASELMVTRDALVTAVSAWCAAAVAGATIYNALYAPAANGLVGAKIADWFSISAAATGLRLATMLSSQALAAHTPYWVLTWSSTGAPGLTGRSGAGGGVPMRVPGALTPPLPQQSVALAYTTPIAAFTGASGPANAAAYFPASPALGYSQTAPQYWWGLKNF